MNKQGVDKNIEGVLFDIDGTLIDSNDAHTKAWLEAFAESNIQLDYHSIRNKIGMGSDHLIPKLIKISNESQVGRKIDKRQGEIFRTKYLPFLKSFPGAKELLQLLKDKGLKLVVASSSSAKDLTELLKIDGLINYFDNLNMATSDTQSKPDPDIILNALSKGNLSKDKALMIGDTPYDIEASIHAGVKVIAFTCGGWSVKDLKGAIAIYESPKHFIENLPKAIQDLS